MYQRGGKDWADYFPKIRDRLLGMQAPDGSWTGDNVGTTYGTALAATILQLPYGYLPIAQR
jgi:squalene cyclase